MKSIIRNRDLLSLSQDSSYRETSYGDFDSPAIMPVTSTWSLPKLSCAQEFRSLGGIVRVSVTLHWVSYFDRDIALGYDCLLLSGNRLKARFGAPQVRSTFQSVDTGVSNVDLILPASVVIECSPPTSVEYEGYDGRRRSMYAKAPSASGGTVEEVKAELQQVLSCTMRRMGFDVQCELDKRACGKLDGFIQKTFIGALYDQVHDMLRDSSMVSYWERNADRVWLDEVSQHLPIMKDDAPRTTSEPALSKPEKLPGQGTW